MSTNAEELIIAHRGESFIAPENTLSAINLAWEKGAKAVEIDVRLTLDKQIVVIHDSTTKRTGTSNLKVKKSTLANLQKIDVGLFKGINWKGEHIPSLIEVLNTIPEKGKLIIEIKSGIEIIEPLSELIKNANITASQILIISFNRMVLSQIKRLLPQYKMLWLLTLDYYLPAWMLFTKPQDIIRKVHASKLDGINVWAGKKLNWDFVKPFKEHNLLVYTWTVNDLNKAKHLANLQVDGITTDKAAWLKNQLLDDTHA